MKEITIKIAENIDEHTIATAIDRLLTKIKKEKYYDFTFTIGRGGNISDWKNSDLKEGLLILIKIQKNKEKQGYVYF